MDYSSELPLVTRRAFCRLAIASSCAGAVAFAGEPLARSEVNAADKIDKTYPPG